MNCSWNARLSVHTRQPLWPYVVMHMERKQTSSLWKRCCHSNPFWKRATTQPSIKQWRTYPISLQTTVGAWMTTSFMQTELAITSVQPSSSSLTTERYSKPQTHFNPLGKLLTPSISANSNPHVMWQVAGTEERVTMHALDLLCLSKRSSLVPRPFLDPASSFTIKNATHSGFFSPTFFSPPQKLEAGTAWELKGFSKL